MLGCVWHAVIVNFFIWTFKFLLQSSPKSLLFSLPGVFDLGRSVRCAIIMITIIFLQPHVDFFVFLLHHLFCFEDENDHHNCSDDWKAWCDCDDDQKMSGIVFRDFAMAIFLGCCFFVNYCLIGNSRIVTIFEFFHQILQKVVIIPGANSKIRWNTV